MSVHPTQDNGSTPPVTATPELRCPWRFPSHKSRALLFYSPLYSLELPAHISVPMLAPCRSCLFKLLFPTGRIFSPSGNNPFLLTLPSRAVTPREKRCAHTGPQRPSSGGLAESSTAFLAFRPAAVCGGSVLSLWRETRALCPRKHRTTNQGRKRGEALSGCQSWGFADLRPRTESGAGGVLYCVHRWWLRGFSVGEWVTGTWFPVTVWCPGARSCARQQCGVYPEGCGVIPVCAGGSVDRAS